MQDALFQEMLYILSKSTATTTVPNGNYTANQTQLQQHLLANTGSPSQASLYIAIIIVLVIAALVIYKYLKSRGTL